MDATEIRETISVDGVMTVRLGETGLWGALRALRTGIRTLRAPGLRVTRFSALAADGRLVRPYDPEAHMLVAGYRLEVPLA